MKILLGLISFLGIYLGFSRISQSNVPENKLSDSKPAEIKILLIGDIMLGRTVNTRSLDMGNVNYPFEKVAEKLRSVDIVFANLESPIVAKCPRIEQGFTFCADSKMIDGLAYAGIDIVTIANNHSHNFGSKGFDETKKLLTEHGIKWVGDNNLEIIEKNGIKFGFMGFDYVAGGPTLKDLELIKESSSKVDVLIVAPHWGWEYNSKANNNQRAWARQIVASGADVISGSHPHWVQDNEKIDDKPVYYSLGNFIFDQMWSEETRKGLAVEITFREKEIVKEVRLPIYMKEWAQPRWVE